MTSIWVVEHGEYDDYQIVALYTNEAAAEKHCKQMNQYEDPTSQYTCQEWGVEDDAPDIYWEFRLSIFKEAVHLFRNHPSPLAMAQDAPCTLNVAVHDGVLSVAGPDRQEVIDTTAAKLKELGW